MAPPRGLHGWGLPWPKGRKQTLCPVTKQTLKPPSPKQVTPLKPVPTPIQHPTGNTCQDTCNVEAKAVATHALASCCQAACATMHKQLDGLAWGLLGVFRQKLCFQHKLPLQTCPQVRATLWQYIEQL